MKFSAFDLETTSTDVAKAGVVQAAVVSAPLLSQIVSEHYWLWCTVCQADGEHECMGHGSTAIMCRTCHKPQQHQTAKSPQPVFTGVQLADATTYSELFYVPEIPAAATRVHGIKTEDVADCKPFARSVRAFAKSLTGTDVIAVSFNGCGYDIPVLVHWLLTVIAVNRSQSGALAWDSRQVEAKRAQVEQHLRKRHIDVMRLWWRMQSERPLAKCFAGTLSGAHLHLVGEMFDGAHDASIDCTATLAVLDGMLRTGFVDVETAIKWSNSPMPGDVDYQGKFKWEGDQVVMGLGKHKGEPLEAREVKGFLKWMLDPKRDFAADTKKIITDYLAGQYPVREYENET